MLGKGKVTYYCNYVQIYLYFVSVRLEEKIQNITELGYYFQIRRSGQFYQKSNDSEVQRFQVAICNEKRSKPYINTAEIARVGGRYAVQGNSRPLSPAVVGLWLAGYTRLRRCEFVNSRIDYCNTVLAGAPRTVTDKLQRVLNAAARVVTGIRKFDRGLGQILNDELHWLDVPDRVFFKLTVLVHRCLNGRAPQYLSDYCVPVASAATRRHLRSANRQLLAVPRYRLNTYGRRAFSVVGPTIWNSLPDFIRDPTESVQSVSDVCLKRIRSLDSAFSSLEILDDYCAI